MILHTLLLITTLGTLSVEPGLRDGSRIFSLPSPPQGAEYHNVEAWAAGSKLELSQTGDNKWIAYTTATRGTFKYVVCDEENCTPVEVDWGGREVNWTGLIMFLLSLVFLWCAVRVVCPGWFK